MPASLSRNLLLLETQLSDTMKPYYYAREEISTHCTDSDSRDLGHQRVLTLATSTTHLTPTKRPL